MSDYIIDLVAKNDFEIAIRDPTRDGCIKEFIRRKQSSGLFWAVGAAERKKPPNCHKYATFGGVFFNVLGATITSSKNCVGAKHLTQRCSI